MSEVHLGSETSRQPAPVHFDSHLLTCAGQCSALHSPVNNTALFRHQILVCNQITSINLPLVDEFAKREVRKSGHKKCLRELRHKTHDVLAKPPKSQN